MREPESMRKNPEESSLNPEELEDLNKRNKNFETLTKRNPHHI